jgi:hypothetical protein
VPDEKKSLDIAVLLSDDPDALLDQILAQLHAHADDEDAVMMIGVGPLETLFHRGFESQLWPRIEQLARDDGTFRVALASVWAYNSPMFDRRRALLGELGADQD